MGTLYSSQGYESCDSEPSRLPAVQGGCVCLAWRPPIKRCVFANNLIPDHYSFASHEFMLTVEL